MNRTCGKRKRIIVIRQLMYYGEEEWVKETLKKSLPDAWKCSRGEIHSTTINSYEVEPECEYPCHPF